MTTVGSAVELEHGGRPGRIPDGHRAPGPRNDGGGRHRRWDPRRTWLLLLGLLFVWALVRSGAGPDAVNSRGWPLVGRFVGAAVTPELSGDFLAVVLRAAGTTIGFALVGTALSVVIGVVGGVVTSETWWRRDPQDRRARRRRLRPGWWGARAGAAVPRGIHEAIWALFLLQILGRDPMVAVLAIGIPFGAITAKVIAEHIDDAAGEGYDALRAAGAGRLTAMLHTIGPEILPDVVSYSFYRLECSLRSAVVLGMIGAGGIGFQLNLSFQSLRYEEIWTLVYALVLMSAVVDRWSAAVRRAPGRRRIRNSALAALGMTAVAGWWLELRPWTIVGERTRRLTSELAGDVWPPRLPTGGWPALWSAMVDTVAISVVAIGIATALAWPVAFVAARDDRGVLGRVLGGTARAVLLFTRSLPPPVWALMVVFVVYPGPLPGGIALGLYTFGVLGRLDAEVIENADRRPRDALGLLGARRATAFAYGTVPVVAPRFTALSLYRWEVTMRETVIVGLVGAGGLGRLLAQQNAALDRAGMVTTVAALVVLSFAVDLLSAKIRSDLR